MTTKMFGAVVAHFDSLNFLFTFSYTEGILGKDRVSTESTTVHFSADRTVAIECCMGFIVKSKTHFSTSATCLIIVGHDLLLS